MIKRNNMISQQDLYYLELCIEQAKKALAAGDRPFGSVLVGNDGKVLMQERNRIHSDNATFHPELAIARWAAANLSAEQRATTTVYTSGEHCPMCASAHALAGLGHIVYASSSEQLASWLEGFGAAPSPLKTMAINSLAPSIKVTGPEPKLASTIKLLHQQYYQTLSH